MKHKLVTLAAALAAITIAMASPSAHAAPDPYMGEIMLMGTDFCPRGWHEADGATVQVQQDTALFSLYGKTFGGDERTFFKLPDLRDKVPLKGTRYCVAMVGVFPARP